MVARAAGVRAARPAQVCPLGRVPRRRRQETTMFMIIPYHVDVPMQRWPWMNWVIIGLTVFFFPLCVVAGELTPLGQDLVLGGGGVGNDSWIGRIGYVLVHADMVHLLGNMLFLWVFGNAVCAKVGNLAYPFIYFGLGLVSGLVSHMIDPRPAVGASGAINGIVGMFIVWYLLNDITCWFGYWYFSGGDSSSFSVSSFWMILLWLAFDIWGAVRGGGNIGYSAHLAGFAAGFLLAILLLVLRWIEMEEGERSLLQVFLGRKEPEPDFKAKARKRRARR
jgi:membrane associated rhomboid family serine protease